IAKGTRTLMDALGALLALSEKERTARGLLFTPTEICQQPATWPLTRQRVEAKIPELRHFLDRSGVLSVEATVRLVGAGTSDHVGRSVRALLARMWQCEVTAVPSTDLLTEEEDW